MLHTILTHPFFSGILLASALCFPQHAWPSLFVFLIPILYSLEKKHPSLWKTGFHISFSIGTALLLATLWFLESYPLDWLHISDPILSSIIIGSIWISFIATLALPFTIWGVILRSFTPFSLHLKALVGSAAWVSIEHLRSWLIAFFFASPETLTGPHHTYYSIAYPIAHVPILKELLPIGGLPLGTLWIILCNFFLYGLLTQSISQKRNGRFHLAFGITLLFLPISCALYMSKERSLQKEVPHTLPAVVLQTSFPSSRNKEDQEKKSAAVLEFLERLEPKKTLVVLPENIDLTSIALENSLATNSYIGSYTGKHGYQMYFFHPDIQNTQFSQKQLLMPLGEYTLPWLERLIRITGNPEWISNIALPNEYQPSKGQGARLFYSPHDANLVIGGTLCSENISPLLHRQTVFGGASLLVHSASLGPFHGSALLSRQMLAINTARALENGRYYLSAANDASSAIISDTGIATLQEKTSTKKEIGAILAKIPLLTYLTPYTILGDILSPIALVFTLITMLWKNWVASSSPIKENIPQRGI